MSTSKDVLLDVFSDLFTSFVSSKDEGNSNGKVSEQILTVKSTKEAMSQKMPLNKDEEGCRDLAILKDGNGPELVFTEEEKRYLENLLDTVSTPDISKEDEIFFHMPYEQANAILSERTRKCQEGIIRSRREMNQQISECKGKMKEFGEEIEELKEYMKEQEKEFVEYQKKWKEREIKWEDTVADVLHALEARSQKFGFDREEPNIECPQWKLLASIKEKSERRKLAARASELKTSMENNYPIGSTSQMDPARPVQQGEKRYSANSHSQSKRSKKTA